MMMNRYPNLLTRQLRKVIERDTIYTIGLLTPISAMVDTFLVEGLEFEFKVAIAFIAVLFVLLSIVRLIKGWVLDRHPLIPIAAYVVLLVPGTAYFAEIRQWWVFIWMIPIFLANFYYGRGKVLKSVIGIFIFTELVLKPIGQTAYASSIGETIQLADYIYIFFEMLAVITLSLLFIDTQVVTEEDRKTLLNSLQKAELEEERLSTLINNLSDGIIATDKEGVVSMYNPTAMNLLDTHEDIKGKPLSQYMKIENDEGLPIAVNDLLKKTQTKYETREFRIPYATGDFVKVHLNLVAIRPGNSEEVAGYVISLHDITKQKTVEEDEKAFISLMSHELRTPLATVEAQLSNAELLLERQGGGVELAKSIKDARQEILSLSHVVDDLDMFSEANTAISAVSLGTVNLAELLGKLVDQYRNAASQKGLTLSVEVPEGLKVQSDAKRITRIIDGLITNAIKYTSAGTITVKAYGKDNLIAIAVTDTGKGIGKADQAKLFKPFQQAEDYERRQLGGTGLGLYVSGKLAASMGGKITVESELNRGSVFTLLLPIEATN